MAIPGARRDNLRNKPWVLGPACWSRTILAALILAQFAWGGSAHATPACSSSSTSTTSTDAKTSTDAGGCQWRYTNLTTTLGGGDSGDFWGSATAPAPETGGSCVLPPCSDGIRQDHGITNVLYNYFYAGTSSATTTTCRFVDNGTSQDLFVPQNTGLEFSDFIQHSPTGVGFSYCAQSEDFPYTATASYPSGYLLFSEGGAPTAPAGSQITVQNAVIPLPTTRVNHDAPAQGYPVRLTYNRQDCISSSSGAPACRSRVIVETQNIQVHMEPGPNSSQCPTNAGSYSGIDCDWQWNPNGGYVSSRTWTVDGVPCSSGVDCYDPPALQSCANTTSAVAGPTITQACPSGTTGTQQCQTVVTNTYACANGQSVLTDQSSPVPVSCVGACVPCATTVLGSTCIASGASEAHAFFYQFSPVSIPANWAATNGAYDDNGVAMNYLTSDNQVNGLEFFTNQVNIPLEPFTQGFPGFSQFTQWFGVCYDGGYEAPTSGNYTFVTAANNGLVLTIDGAQILDDEGSLSPAAPDPLLGATVNLSAGLHDVVVRVWQGWSVGALGFQLWAMAPGQPVNPAWLRDETFGADSLVGPPPSDVMQLTGPPGGVLNCPYNVAQSAVCGSEWASGISFDQPLTDLCDVGNPSTATANDGNGTWNWTCTGIGGGADVSCWVTAATCGAANGAYVAAAPNADLCSSNETASAVSAASSTGPWTWTCSSGGGVSIPCSATVGSAQGGGASGGGGSGGSGSGDGGGSWRNPPESY